MVAYVRTCNNPYGVRLVEAEKLMLNCFFFGRHGIICTAVVKSLVHPHATLLYDNV